MAEAITVCENICQDFNWLSGLSSWLLPALLGSATALLIAFKAYPWQKNLDRALQIDIEKRQAYKDFFSSLIEVFNKAHNGTYDEFLDALRVNRPCFNSLVFYAPLEVIAEARKCIEKIMEYRPNHSEGPLNVSIFNEALAFEMEALRLARLDIMKDPDDAQSVVELIYSE